MPSLILTNSWSLLYDIMYGPEDEQNFATRYTFSGSDDLIDITKIPVTVTDKKNHLWKYNEDKILKDVEDYVTTTYHGHYCGDSDGYADIQTIDLMAAKKLAASFFAAIRSIVWMSA